MADKTPLKYEAGEHLPFAAGDTLAPSLVNLLALIEAGTGVQIIDNGDGTLTLVNLCCAETDPPA